MDYLSEWTLSSWILAKEGSYIFYDDEQIGKSGLGPDIGILGILGLRVELDPAELSFHFRADVLEFIELGYGDISPLWDFDDLFYFSEDDLRVIVDSVHDVGGIVERLNGR